MATTSRWPAADEELGGRVARESRLPGLSAWGRVRDYRVHQIRQVAAASVVMVTSRLPDDALYRELAGDEERLSDAGIASLHRIGDCHGPATIAAAVYEGHRFARELGAEPEDIPFKRELTELAAEFALP